MVAKNTGDQASNRQQALFEKLDFPSNELVAPNTPCKVFEVGKRRDGGTRYWCGVHRADATAKYGKPATKCVAADEPPLLSKDILELNLDKYMGGVALWGAVPAVYDTTRFEMDRGVHVHARPKLGEKKEIDWTRRAVRLFGNGLPKFGVLIQEIDAIYYMVTTVFGFEMSYVRCTHCGWPHLDKDFFSVHPHQRHLCAGCGHHFRDAAQGIGNPIVGIRQICGVDKHRTSRARENLVIRQADYSGGVQVWGSNAAFIWTGEHEEADGIHVHAYIDGQAEPVLDETYNMVTIDGIKLDPKMVRILMAQNVLPSLKGRVSSVNCPSCKHAQFDIGEDAYTPKAKHTCHKCGNGFGTTGRLRNVVSNPLTAILERLAKLAPRQPQNHRLDLRPETL